MRKIAGSNTTACLKIFFTSLLFISVINTSAQKALIHSHNDYERRVPFYQAYAQQVYSIEADIYALDGKPLLVGHSRSDLSDDRTMENMYINPIVNIFKENKGRAWRDSDKIFQLLIDLKTPTEPTMAELIKLVEKHPETFDPQTNPLAVRIVITGFVPKPEDFSKYPDYIFFDGLTSIAYTPEQLRRIALISLPLYKYVDLKQKDIFTQQEKESVIKEIEKAHNMGKLIRFWGAPDNIFAWTTLYVMGADIINTDQVENCTEFFENLDKIRK